jgi:hypothetical protein
MRPPGLPPFLYALLVVLVGLLIVWLLPLWLVVVIVVVLLLLGFVR